MMPYQHFRYMSDEDAKSVVAYLRTLKPIHRGVPPKKLNFPVNFIVKFIPKPLDAPSIWPAGSSRTPSPSAAPGR